MLGTITIIASTIVLGGIDLVFIRFSPSWAASCCRSTGGSWRACWPAHPGLTRAMVVVAGLSSQWVIAALGWATILVLLAARRFRHLLVFLGAALLIHAITSNLACNTIEQVSALRPAEIAMLGPTGKSAYPVVPLATLTGRLVSMLYCLVPQGRRRRQEQGGGRRHHRAGRPGPLYLAVARQPPSWSRSSSG